MIRMPHLGGAHPDPNMHWDYQRPTAPDRPGWRRHGLLRLRRRRPARAQGVGEIGQSHRRAHLPRRLRDLPAATTARTRSLERETLHIMDDKQRIALVETRTLDTAGNDPAPPQLIRYQFGNHLGSASLELDDQAQIISYEEYTPTAARRIRRCAARPRRPKRYRYTGKERDEESGLYYHGARYYAPWLGRWVSCDPAGLIDGSNILPIRSINFLFPEFQAAYRAPSLILAVAEYPPGPLTGVSADAEFPLQWHA